ncbi:Signal recognition particle-docking protein FtsY [Planctomycetales bacterium 10988]|nr:Signal recognition particle-docking protein FtsY [Planctomycetales bacterium 10988]
MGWLDSIRRGLKKTKNVLFTDVRDLFKKEGRLVDEEFIDDLLAILVRTDMGIKAARAITKRIQTDFRGRVVHLEEIMLVIREEIQQRLEAPGELIRYAEEGPTVIMVEGVNGAGKTTSIAKLVRYFKEEGKSVLLGAADTFRAAATEQLQIWAGRLEVPIVTGPPNSDPASVAHRAAVQAKEENFDVCIVDTAGRQQTQHNLMQQLNKIHRVLGKQVPDAPHEVLLVLDATTGQSGIAQAEGFTEASPVTGIFLAKLDGTAKGGVVVAIHEKFDIPVKFVGVGEQAEDLALFEPQEYVEQLFQGLF